MKALGVGLGAFGWADVEVVRAPGGAPGPGGDRPGRRRWRRAGRRRPGSLSITHTATVASAVVAAVGVIPVLTPAEMAEVDRQAAEPVEVLIERAGFAVARAARRMLGGGYGRRVVVVAGRGNNGADGRAAARLLARWGRPCRCSRRPTSAGGRALPARPTWSSTPPTAPG